MNIYVIVLMFSEKKISDLFIELLLILYDLVFWFGPSISGTFAEYFSGTLWVIFYIFKILSRCTMTLQQKEMAFWRTKPPSWRQRATRIPSPLPADTLRLMEMWLSSLWWRQMTRPQSKIISTNSHYRLLNIII